LRNLEIVLATSSTTLRAEDVDFETFETWLKILNA